MKTIGFVLLALAGGFAAGILLSEIIGIFGMLVFQQSVGINYLPVYLAVLSAGAALVIILMSRRKSE